MCVCVCMCQGGSGRSWMKILRCQRPSLDPRVYEHVYVYIHMKQVFSQGGDVIWVMYLNLTPHTPIAEPAEIGEFFGSPKWVSVCELTQGLLCISCGSCLRSYSRRLRPGRLKGHFKYWAQPRQLSATPHVHLGFERVTTF